MAALGWCRSHMLCVRFRALMKRTSGGDRSAIAYNGKVVLGDILHQHLELELIKCPMFLINFPPFLLSIFHLFSDICSGGRLGKDAWFGHNLIAAIGGQDAAVLPRSNGTLRTGTGLPCSWPGCSFAAFYFPTSCINQHHPGVGCRCSGRGCW